MDGGHAAAAALTSSVSPTGTAPPSSGPRTDQARVLYQSSLKLSDRRLTERIRGSTTPPEVGCVCGSRILRDSDKLQHRSKPPQGRCPGYGRRADEHIDSGPQGAVPREGAAAVQTSAARCTRGPLCSSGAEKHAGSAGTRPTRQFRECFAVVAGGENVGTRATCSYLRT
jgi:hypothetical protein